ncbi:winged helix-turn-helix transcriptional regulator, partial [Sphingomonas koreensis]|uniref:winged helix-turn-helix transcriptional regulator n=1 Tax=Sphingomonas koreensis TaxID=93064 RepID=UPI0013E07DB6
MNDPVLSPAVLQLLSASRWAIPVLALLSREQGSRFAVIERRFGLSRNSLTRTLAYLREQGWVMPNPGYGHPLRPEYVLSDAGRAIGAACERIEGVRIRLGLEAPDLSRWTLPVAGGLEDEWTRFNALQTRLAPVTPRARPAGASSPLQVRRARGEGRAGTRPGSLGRPLVSVIGRGSRHRTSWAVP